MAVLTAPLLSFGASGQIAKAAVYMRWKGLNTVRKYVIPANPQSDPQILQRGYLSDSVDTWHVHAYTAADVVAWNRYAGTLAKIMSGFNAMIRLQIASHRDAIGWTKTSDVRVAVPTAVGFDVDVENSFQGKTFRAAIGVRRTHFPVLVALVDDVDDTYSLTWAAGASGIDYYVKVEEQVAGTWYQRTGIYHIKTS